MKVWAISALIIAGGAMLAAMASAFVAFLASATGDDLLVTLFSVERVGFFLGAANASWAGSSKLRPNSGPMCPSRYSESPW